ncbi:hypothetical protein [Methylobacterium sp. Leaf89]|uniref:hypothetical protein n=1 Tax=Methylobacterium sp. Leaf89 TaxID=1736245 RepID=UPI0006F3E969|nr:hypothetical protein [Methylobacterium sp. Leaf89]KQO71185.1 hypothetical protein ASF18_01510 [Methylobacterium sp. Leaf89]
MQTDDQIQRSRRSDRLERTNALVQTLAILAAGAWAVYTFIYEARIKPALEPPAVSVTTSLVRAGERDRHVAIRSTVTRKNVGQTGVRVLGLVYNVTGVRVRFDASSSGKPEDGQASADRTRTARAYDFAGSGEAILREGRLFAGATAAGGEPSDLNPGESVSRDLIVYADRDRFDFVRFEVSLAYTKGDEPPVLLTFETAPNGTLALKPDADCRADPQTCDRLKTTDFGTEFSLW